LSDPIGLGILRCGRAKSQALAGRSERARETLRETRTPALGARVGAKSELGPAPTRVDAVLAGGG